MCTTRLTRDSCTAPVSLKEGEFSLDGTHLNFSLSRLLDLGPALESEKFSGTSSTRVFVY